MTGAFREDLYHRLAVFPIKLPPLRERRTDLLRSRRRCSAASPRPQAPPAAALAAAEQRLLRRAWRGNVRELANALERAAILADGDAIDAATSARRAAAPRGRVRRCRQPLAELERDAIQRALDAVGGNRSRPPSCSDRRAHALRQAQEARRLGCLLDRRVRLVRVAHQTGTPRVRR